MERDFQTSFIPKKPMIEESRTTATPVGFLTILSIFIFFTMILASGGLFFYKNILERNVVSMEDTLTKAKARFEPETIVRIQTTDKRLKSATAVLSKHVAVTPIFEALQALTMKTIRYTKFSYKGEEDGKVAVQMQGVAIGYRSIALQSDLFAKNKYIIDPIFSNLTLDNTGNVLFDLNFWIDPNFVDYEELLKTESETEAVSTSSELEASGGEEDLSDLEDLLGAEEDL